MMRWIVLGVCLAAGCAAPATELKSCPSGDCEAEARAAELAQEQKVASEKQTARLRTPGLLNHASFDLNCPGADIVVIELSEYSRGVRGCGKQATYAHRWPAADEWVLDSAVTARR